MAAVVDPQRDVDQYLADAEALGLSIRHVIPHALPRRLRRRPSRAARPRGAEIVPRSTRERPSTQFAPGRTATRSRSGRRCASRCSRHPGHSPESISIVVYDEDATAPSPYAVLTGDTLFIGDVGRPDLRAVARLERRGARQRCSTTRSETSCSRSPTRRSSTPRTERARSAARTSARTRSRRSASSGSYNYALQPMTKEEFVRIVTADQPDTPAYFTLRRDPQHEGATDARARRSSAS